MPRDDKKVVAEDSYDRLTEAVNGTFGALQGLIKVVKKEVGSFGRLHSFLTSAARITLGKLYT